MQSRIRQAKQLQPRAVAYFRGSLSLGKGAHKLSTPISLTTVWPSKTLIAGSYPRPIATT